MTEQSSERVTRTHGRSGRLFVLLWCLSTALWIGASARHSGWVGLLDATMGGFSLFIAVGESSRHFRPVGEES